MKYCQIKIVRPIVLHDKEVVNIDELRKELTLYKELGANGIYVYRQGIDYPHGRGWIHCCLLRNRKGRKRSYNMG